MSTPSLPELDLDPAKLAEARVDAGYSQQRAADAVGLTVVSVQNYEAGRRSPRLPHIARLARLYGRTVDSLLVGDETDPPIRERAHADTVVPPNPGALPQQDPNRTSGAPRTPGPRRP